MNSQRIAVVGANGYIGRNLISSFANTDNQVFKITSNNKELMLDPNFWIDSEFDSVIWLASSVNPLVAQNEPKLADYEIESFKKYVTKISESRAQIVFISSGGTVYSGNRLPFTEDTEANGVNAYGRHKVSLEKILEQESSNFIILRLSNAYGRDQVLKNGQGVISGWLDSANRGLPLTVFGSITHIRDFIYVDDVLSAIQQVVKKQLRNEVFNIGSGEGTSLERLISEISLVTEKELDIELLEPRGFDRSEVWLDISKAEEMLSWKPVVNLHDGVDLTWQAMNSGVIK